MLLITCVNETSPTQPPAHLNDAHIRLEAVTIDRHLRYTFDPLLNSISDVRHHYNHDISFNK